MVFNISNPHAVNLACNIVAEQFGDVCEVVCRSLLRRGRSTVQDIVFSCKLPPQQVRNALLILLQHNCAMAYTMSSMGGNRPGGPNSIFEADVPGILHRIRMPRCMDHIREQYRRLSVNKEWERRVSKPKTPHEAVMGALLRHGRLRADQMVAAVAELVEFKLEQSAPDLPQEDVLRALAKMIQDRYVERVPICTMPPPRTGNAARPQGRQRVKPPQLDEVEQQAEDQRIEDEALQRRRRFHLTLDLAAVTLGNTPAARVPSTPQETKRKPGKEPAAKKMRRTSGASVKPAEVGLSEMERDMPEESGNVLWRANREHFLRMFTQEACVDGVRQLRGKKVGSFIHAMLHCLRQYPLNSDETLGVTQLELSVAVDQLIVQAHDFALRQDEDLGHFMRILTRTQRLPRLVVSCGDNGCAVTISDILDYIRMQHVTSIIQKRFGDEGRRVFRLVLSGKQVELDQIHAEAVIEAKDLRSAIYNMLAFGFLTVQDLPKTSDHAPSATLYTLRVDIPAVYDRVGTGVLQSISNLRMRLQYEVRQQEEMLEAVQSGADGQAGRPSYSAALEKLRQIDLLLNTRVTALEPMLLLFTGL